MNSPRVIPIQPEPAQDDGPEMVSLYASQAKVYPRSVSGRFARWRWVMVWLTQLFFYGLPWLNWNGRQAVLFDLGERRFYILGLVMQPQDFIYLAALLVIAALSLFFFTAVAGRLWCGYACPQTVYTEIFLWIERRVEGDRQARMRLDAAPWSARKLGRKALKQTLWLGVALFTGFSFVGYFTPIRELSRELALGAFSPWEWFWVLFYGLATYGNAGYMREQICKYMCPYARFQSALIDMDSLVIAYDTRRGEPRGSRPRKADPASLGLGSCIDCTLCVQVCPTGIDIRQGLQNECIACAACIDVCDDVMGKMGYPPGLIRYSSGHAMEQQLPHAALLRRVLRPRVLIYAGLLSLTCLGFALSLVQRHDFAVNVIKDRGTLARQVGRGDIENVYRLQVINSTEQAHRFKVEVLGPPGLALASEPGLSVPATGIGTLALSLTLAGGEAESHRGQVLPLQLRITRERAPGDQGAGESAITEKTTFVVPR
ncbi:cytochrome c oxidase accessory protein CcoG [Curvibacter gracilis]|uniref:cytochrome c oxidase accessory protein CcoG n=1 Tax=Curvibacter gracilis TaxID=230310 RepID=UPI0004879142|nr:cytochrome c oxidase accessory protein CcoG [Curvibacter gracilis]